MEHDEYLRRLNRVRDRLNFHRREEKYEDFFEPNMGGGEEHIMLAEMVADLYRDTWRLRKWGVSE